MSKDKCMINPKIPLWLIVSGAGGLFLTIVRFVSNIAAGVKYIKSFSVFFLCEKCIITLN